MGDGGAGDMDMMDAIRESEQVVMAGRITDPEVKWPADGIAPTFSPLLSMTQTDCTVLYCLFLRATAAIAFFLFENRVLESYSVRVVVVCDFRGITEVQVRWP